MSKVIRFTINDGVIRRSISLDSYLAELLARRLGYFHPWDQNAYSLVRSWMDGIALSTGKKATSNVIRTSVINAIADKELLKRMENNLKE